MKTIPYINKDTKASTQYRKTTKQDIDWVLTQCKRIAQVAPISDELRTPNPKMPRMSAGGRNTPESMCKGVIDNFNAGQYDLSDKQCTGLEEAFRIGEEVIEDFEGVVFEQVDVLPKMKSVVQVPTEPPGTFGDLFDIESITVTYRKHK